MKYSLCDKSERAFMKEGSTHAKPRAWPTEGPVVSFETSQKGRKQIDLLI